jgi:hypothetical protein
VAGEALDGRAVEEVRRVFDRAGEAAGGLHQRERQVELGGGALPVDRREGQVSKPQLAHRSVLERQHDLEQRGVREAALDRELVDEQLDGEVLMVVGREGRRTHALQRREEALAASQAQREDEGVDEHPDQPLGLHPAAVGDRRADEHVVRTRPAVEEGLEGREEDHERRGARALRERMDGV